MKVRSFTCAECHSAFEIVGKGGASPYCPTCRVSDKTATEFLARRELLAVIST